MSNNIFIKNRNDKIIRNKRLFSNIYDGIKDFSYSGQKINDESIEKYTTQDNKKYDRILSGKVLEDISFIPLQNYVKHIYSGLYFRREPYQYETGVYGLPNMDISLITDQVNYINYEAKSYIQASYDPYYDAFMPKSGENHILVLDLNLYGFEEDSMEDCDIELNALVLKTGYFHEIIKDPTILDLEINDITPTYSKINSVHDYIQQKRILKSCDSNNFISYNASFNQYDPNVFSNKDSIVNQYKFIKNIIKISSPFISDNKNIPLPCFFEYKSATNNLTYNIGEYGFFIYSDAKTLESGYYITGTQTGFLYFLNPGTYTTIISGNENDFLHLENNLSGKNQNINLLSMNIDFITGERLQEIYIENQDKIWASYLLDSTELVLNSGFNKLNAQDPIAFAIDFERSISGQLESPFLTYREQSGVYQDLCTPIIISAGFGQGCSTSFCLICDQAAKLYNEGKRVIDVPKQYVPIRTYGNILTYLDPDPSPSTYRISIDASLLAECCACKEIGCKDIKQQTITKLNKPSLTGSGSAVSTGVLDSGIFFIDELNHALIHIKYNLNYYSGQIGFNSFYEGDKIKFKQYPFDYDKGFENVYGYKPLIKEYKTEFTYSKSKIGIDYFSGKQDLIDKINLKFASSGLFSWKPLKYYPTPQYEYGPLLTGIDGGIDASGNNVINLISLRSGKFGSHKIELDLQPRLEIYNYLVPKIMRLEISDDYVNWTGVTTSENRLPINLYIKNPNRSVPTEIPYDDIPNTVYKIPKNISISSEIETIDKSEEEEEEEDLEDLVQQFASGNIVSGETICILDPTSSGVVCGSGYKDFMLGNLFSFQCKEKDLSLEDLGGLDTGVGGLTVEQPQDNTSTSKEENNTGMFQEINRFRISYYDYLS